MVTRGLYSYLIFTQKIVNRAKKGVLHGTPKFFLKVSQDVFTMHNTQSTKINRIINFILHGLATRRLSVKKKVTRNRDFFPPCRNWPICPFHTLKSYNGLVLLERCFQGLGPESCISWSLWTSLMMLESESLQNILWFISKPESNAESRAEPNWCGGDVFKIWFSLNFHSGLDCLS